MGPRELNGCDAQAFLFATSGTGVACNERCDPAKVKSETSHPDGQTAFAWASDVGVVGADELVVLAHRASLRFLL